MGLNKAEQDLYYWKNGLAGSFASALFELICKADTWNQALLSLGFTKEVEAIQRFQTEKGYWEYIQREMKK